MLIHQELTNRIIGAAIEVHKHLGPGLLESCYERCLKHELEGQGMTCRTQVDLPVKYTGELIDCGYRIDAIVNELVLLEIKAVDSLHSLHEAQLITYLKLSGIKVGLLLNFNTLKMKEGIVHRVV